MLKKIDQIEQFEEILKTEPKFFFLKHSLTCPISQAAFKEYQSFTQEHNEIPTYYLAVQDSRSLSNSIAEKFQIKHESPQAILFVNGNPTWNASHWKIKNSTLAGVLN